MGNGVGYIERKFGKNTEVSITQEWVMNQKATLATKMVEKWGMVAGSPDGEDSAGRARVRRATPEELVSHAMLCADLLVESCRDSGWITDLPTPEVEQQP